MLDGRRTTIDYGIYAQYGLPYLVTEFAADVVTELRHSFTDYNLSQPYLDRHIIGLVSEIHLTNASQWQAKMSYAYDDPATLQSQATTAIQHDQSYSASFTARGNVTGVSRWDVTDITNASKKLTTEISYDAAGSVLTTSDPLGHQSSLAYADSFSDGNNHNTFAYPTSATDADGFATTLQYNFDFGAVTWKQTPQPNVTTNQPGPQQTFEYDSFARLARVTNLSNNAYTRFVYGPNYVESFASVNNVADEAHSVQVFDGAGRSIANASLHPGSAGGFSGQLTLFDRMGRAIKSSNPTEIAVSISGAAIQPYNWSATGDDASAGWLYTQQTYDWKGRPLVTTNTDGTTKEASYNGCGCAGGEVTTLTDEGTIDAGVAKRRQQKIYADVLGRTVKTEILNWQGGSVYSTTVNNYNARDQITSIKEFQGADTSGIFQEATMTYDGYGRLKTKHAPEQNTGTATTYSYNADDTVSTVTDARGANSAFTYNNRRLVAGISYSAPSGILATPNVSFTYDAAGNRTAMTDGLGSQTYQYNQLSQVTSETRNLTGIGSFALSYSYNLANELTSITDPFSSNVGYQYDLNGRLSQVTGSGLGVANYISQVSYRAWNGPKQLSYGNGLTTNVSYNNRVGVSRYEGLQGASVKFGADYQSYADGAVSYSHDLTDNRMDRSYSYDHAGRVVAAKSGAEARGEPPTDNRPYRQAYSYDVWGNTTSRLQRHWTQDFNFDASYLNNRNTQYNYDAAGNYTGHYDGSSEWDGHSYDAAGRETTYTDYSSDGYQITNTTTRGFDGDGQMVKESFAATCPSCVPQSPVVAYYIRSSLLGGQVVATVNDQGQRQWSYVYANGELIASHTDQWSMPMQWRHIAPSGSGEWRTYPNFGADGITERIEADPVGADVGTDDPYVGGGGANNGEQNGDLTSRLADASDFSRCNLDGIRMPCGRIMWDASAIGPSRSIRRVIYQGQATWAIFHAYADGYQGLVPVAARYAGNGNFEAIHPISRGYFRSHQRQTDTDFPRLNQSGDNETDLARSSEVRFRSTLPQKTTGTKQETKECADMRAKLLGDPMMNAALDDVWNRSQASPQHPKQEEGGLLGRTGEEGLNVDSVFTRQGKLAGALEGFSIWADRKIRHNRGSVTYEFWYHSHPHDEFEMVPGEGKAGTPDFPSPDDLGVSKDLGLLGILVSKKHIAVFDKDGFIRCHFDR